MKGTITLSQKQIKQLNVINNFINGVISRTEAAQQLGISTRQVSRIKKGVIESGAESLIHKNTGRKPAHAIDEEMKKTILEKRSLPKYSSSNFLHFRDILYEDFKIELSYSAIYSILTEAGIKSPKKRRHKKNHSRRKRKKRSGELIQIDATPYDWFGNGINYALHGAIDDATGNVVGLYITQNECLFGYFEVMRQCVLKYGCPLSLYSDKHTIFRSPKADSMTTEKILSGQQINLTQFGRAMDELACDIIWANSPQAKGRVERLWGTLQSRLPIDLARKGIKNVKEANEFLYNEYIDYFNEHFGEEPECGSVFVPLREDIDIDSVLCIKQTRKTDNAGVFSFKNKTLKIIPDMHPVVPAKKRIEVLVSPRIGICAKYNDHIYQTIRYIPPLRKPKSKAKKPKKVLNEVSTHLKYGSEEWKKIWHYESYDESLRLLYDIFFRPQQASSR